jgi:periplasmic copper chaperone A
MKTRDLPIRLPGSRPARVAIVLALMLPVCNAFADVTVTHPWVRGTVAPQKTTGAFMTLTSTSDAKLVSATSPSAKQVEIHEMVMVNNVMRMRPVAEVPLPAGKDVAFKPGGYHIMLMGIEHQLKQGDVVPITLTVREGDGKSRTVAVQAEVRDLAAAGASKSMSNDKH